MSSPVRVWCDGEEVITDLDGVPHCVQGDGVTAGEWVTVASSFDDVDVEVAGALFATGFVLVGIAWGIGYSVRCILEIIRR